MVSIEGETVIRRPIDVVFDFVADERNEPAYNPGMLRAEKVTDGPVGQGTRFHSAIRSMGRPLEMDIELTEYQRPTRLISVTTMSSADIRGGLSFEPDPGGTRMRWSWEVKPKGVFKVLTPVLARRGKRQEEAIWAGLKEHLEEIPKVV
jgi:hypothetical protein